MTDDTEDQNKKAKELQEKFAKAMSKDEAPKGVVINMGDFLERRMNAQGERAKEHYEKACKLNNNKGEVEKNPFAAPLLNMFKNEAEKAQKTRDHLIFIRAKEAEAAMIEARQPEEPKPAMATVIQLRPRNMNWGLPILEKNPPKQD